MKKQNNFHLVIFLIISIIILRCAGDSKKISKSDAKNQESTSVQELELPQKRIVYHIPEMENVNCLKGITYHSVDEVELKADIYLPPNTNKSVLLPVVILASNYPDSVINQYWVRDQKDMELFISWAELIAASGMIAITYQTQFSHSETDSLINFLIENANKYNINMNKIGLFGCSANTLAVQSLMQCDEYNIKCAILYYGILQTPDHKYNAEIDTSANLYRFYWADLREINKIPTNIPLLVASAGNDRFPIVKNTTDYFVTEAIKSNAQLTYINYSEGQHDFDILDDTKISRSIIRQTVDFMTVHLLE